jgi:hypothetical protein
MTVGIRLSARPFKSLNAPDASRSITVEPGDWAAAYDRGGRAEQNRAKTPKFETTR